MGKLDKQTFNKETLIEYKKLRKNNPEIIGVQELFCDYVGDILKKENKTSFEKNDFEVFEGYFENIKNYQEVLKEKGLNISIEKTKMFILGQNIDEFKKFIKNNKVLDIIEYSSIKNIKLFFSKDFFNITDKKSFDEFLEHPKLYIILDLIYYGNKEKVEIFFSKDFYNVTDKKSFDEFLEHPKLNKILDLIHGYIESINVLFSKDYGNITDKKSFEDFLKYPKIDEIIHLINMGNPEYIKTFFCKNGLTVKEFSANTLGGNFNLLFPVESSGSKVFDEIVESMKEQADKDIYEILREKVNNYLYNKNLEKQEVGELEIAIYLRYTHTVNYPEIGELIIIFMQEAIKRGLLKSVKGIKILPREKFVSPRDTILDENSRFCDVFGEDFKREINNSITFYLSHSINESKGLGVVSSSMEQKGNQINLGLELEARYDNVKTNKKTINEVFDILFKIIGELNKNL